MPSYVARFIESEPVAEGTLAFHFEKPETLRFKAGQFVNITLVNPPDTDALGNSRPFTVASSPDEPRLTIATRMRDTAFKRNLKTLPPGAEVKLRGPFGDLVLPDNPDRPIVFLAGGIGITPFLSMSCFAAAEKLPHAIFLFYSNRRPEDAPYIDKLTALEEKNPHFKFIGTMTNMQDSKMEWRGETGYINRNMLTRYLGDLRNAVYFTAGPPAMVAAMKKMVKDAGVPEERIKAENFDGYA